MNSATTKKRNFKHKFFAIKSQVNSMLNDGYTKDYIYNHFLAQGMISVGYPQFVKYTLTYCRKNPVPPENGSYKTHATTEKTTPHTESQTEVAATNTEEKKPPSIFDNIGKKSDRKRNEYDYNPQRNIEEVYKRNRS